MRRICVLSAAVSLVGLLLPALQSASSASASAGYSAPAASVADLPAGICWTVPHKTHHWEATQAITADEDPTDVLDSGLVAVTATTPLDRETTFFGPLADRSEQQLTLTSLVSQNVRLQV